jgi:DNA ligase D-like protein (predicted 3'-phosphoesterase)
VGDGDEDRLKLYRGKRHFGTTGEPRGAEAPPGGEPSFVIQIHEASTTHFDFRLEVDGLLKSWSVPKGPSTDPNDKRLAVPTEDHPLEYQEYEGVIPGGQYGAGAVIVWDRGTYRPHQSDGPDAFARALEHGHASFTLNGAKLRGGYALTRIRSGKDGEREAWLLVKEKEAKEKGKPATKGAASGAAKTAASGTPDPRRARSALSGRTLRQVADVATESESEESDEPDETDETGA